MFRHKGKNRQAIHNLQLASLLSFVAGIVNVMGFLAVTVLTTNVTGHFAYFADNILRRNFSGAWVFLTYILCYLAGAFVSNTILETGYRLAPRHAQTIPVFAEILLLSTIAFPGFDTIHQAATATACILLFAMGLQNAMVTRISNAVVRTTHLTGLFTDLGIDISQLLFYSRSVVRKQLITSVILRLSIIVFFFLGCIVGGVGYSYYHNKVLILAIVCLAIGAVYSTLRYHIVIAHKIRSRRSA
ncbi:DUF1275 domain-containing protein [Mucilaginibacter daejeonensis]|uniref:YoaK family protein n=1 Tax=Mucilaginibacter daejeonensis TaxID=398049 RepID=UPI001D170891|nr:YoaK family protein [Mucilaginibacter daejeonensis]UEG54073.1 DUF1275 domain-containing protein [Mucilaginibacter daejeonensis]